MLRRALAILAICLLPSGAFAQSFGSVGGQNTNLTPATANITAADVGSTSTTGFAGNGVITGSATAGSTASFVVNGQQTARLQLSGTWTGTVQFEESIDGGTTWGGIGCSLRAIQSGGCNTISGVSATGNGIFDASISGSTNVRVRATAWTSGTLTVTPVFSAHENYVAIGNGVRIGSGSAGSFTQITVEPASTTPAATDTALNVVFSPNALGCAGQSLANTKQQAINNAASSTALKIVTKVASQNVYICALDIGPINAANNVALVEGTLTTTNCDTATAGLAGGTTAATGWIMSAGGGLSYGNGQGIVFKTGTVNHDVCLFFSAASQVSGSITYTQAP